MINQLITEFPISDFPKERSISKEKINKYAYTKEEVDALIDAAVEKAVAEGPERLMKSQWRSTIVMPQLLV